MSELASVDEIERGPERAARASWRCRSDWRFFLDGSQKHLAGVIHNLRVVAAATGGYVVKPRGYHRFDWRSGCVEAALHKAVSLGARMVDVHDRVRGAWPEQRLRVARVDVMGAGALFDIPNDWIVRPDRLRGTTKYLRCQ